MKTDLVRTNPMEQLDPRQRTAVELYTNPLMGRTFGSKQAACIAAGYEGKNAYQALNRKDAVAAIQWVQDQRDEAGAQVADLISRHAIDAAHKLVRQIGMDDGIELHPMPEGLLDKEVEPIMGVDKDGNEVFLGYNEGHLKQAKAITDHNKATANVMREVRGALQMILAYHLGTPEQKIRVAREREAQDPLDLGKATAEELRELAIAVRSAMDDKAPSPKVEEDGAVVEADYEIVSTPTTKTDGIQAEVEEEPVASTPSGADEKAHVAPNPHLPGREDRMGPRPRPDARGLPF